MHNLSLEDKKKILVSLSERNYSIRIVESSKTKVSGVLKRHRNGEYFERKTGSGARKNLN